MKYKKPKPSDVAKFRKKWLDKGYELVDVTQLVEFKISCHGECGEFGEPSENIYHCKIIYRGEEIGVFCPDNTTYFMEDNFVLFTEGIDYGTDFIIFMKVKK